ncbi:MAG: serine hydrolase [Terriglobales bacterium]|jgi:beta-lactamase class A
MIRATRYTIVLAAVATLLMGGSSFAQAADRTDHKREVLWQKLEAKTKALDEKFDGVLGVAVFDPADGKTLLVNGDEVFPQASSIKIAILAELYRQEQQSRNGASGKARLADVYTVQKEDLVADSDIMLGLTPGVTRITNRDLATMMVAVSDNSAANVLIGRLGMDNVNATLASVGLKNTQLRRKMMDLNAAREGRENVATPREMLLLLQTIYANKLFSKELTDDFITVLATSWEQNSKRSAMVRGLPAGVRSAEKPGELEGVRADSGYVFAPNRPYILCVMTTYDKDEKQAEDVISQIATETYAYFDLVGRASDYGRVISPRNSK